MVPSHSGKGKVTDYKLLFEKKIKNVEVDYSETEDTDTVDDDDASQTRKVRSKVGLLTKFLFFSVLVGFLAVAGLSVGMDDYRKYVSPETFKVHPVFKQLLFLVFLHIPTLISFFFFNIICLHSI